LGFSLHPKRNNRKRTLQDAIKKLCKKKRAKSIKEPARGQFGRPLKD